jgi:hypothetical protein
VFDTFAVARWGAVVYAAEHFNFILGRCFGRGDRAALWHLTFVCCVGGLEYQLSTVEQCVGVVG